MVTIVLLSSIGANTFRILDGMHLSILSQAHIDTSFDWLEHFDKMINYGKHLHTCLRHGRVYVETGPGA